MAVLITLLPSGVKLDASPTRATALARYVRLEYGDRDPDWIVDEGGSRAWRTSESHAVRPPRARRIGGIVATLTSLFRSGRRQDDCTTETAPSVDGADAPSLAR